MKRIMLTAVVVLCLAVPPAMAGFVVNHDDGWHISIGCENWMFCIQYPHLPPSKPDQ